MRRSERPQGSLNQDTVCTCAEVWKTSTVNNRVHDEGMPGASRKRIHSSCAWKDKKQICLEDISLHRAELVSKVVGNVTRCLVRHILSIRLPGTRAGKMLSQRSCVRHFPVRVSGYSSSRFFRPSHRYKFPTVRTSMLLQAILPFYMRNIILLLVSVVPA